MMETPTTENAALPSAGAPAGVPAGAPAGEQPEQAGGEGQGSPPIDSLLQLSLEQLTAKMQAAVARAGWTELMPVQARAIAYLMAGRDVMVQSRTGSGKTGAFVLPMLERINPLRPVCQALVLVPTRELAVQVSRDATLLLEDAGIRTVAVYGGVRYGPQIEAFKQGAHLVVGTPGRVLDHLLKRHFVLDDLALLIFDEADRMMSMGFYPDMREIQRYLPARRVEAYMFSATFPPFVLRLARQFLHEPDLLNLSSDHVHVTSTDHRYYVAPGMEKDRALVRLIEVENPTSAIIFCNTRSRVHYVATVLKRFGYNADELSSDLSQNERERVMGRVRKGTLRFLVATDVAARGIDIPELSHVIQFEPPEDPEAYIHRAGRTGRAGASGVAITLVDVVEQLKLVRIGNQYGINLEEWPLPSQEDVATLVSERVTVLLEAQLRQRDRLQTERMARFLPLVQELGQDEDQLALLAMLLDDYYQESLHTPPAEMPAPAAQPRKKKGKRKGGRRRRY